MVKDSLVTPSGSTAFRPTSTRKAQPSPGAPQHLTSLDPNLLTPSRPVVKKTKGIVLTRDSFKLKENLIATHVGVEEALTILEGLAVDQLGAIEVAHVDSPTELEGDSSGFAVVQPSNRGRGRNRGQGQSGLSLQRVRNVAREPSGDQPSMRLILESLQVGSWNTRGFGDPHRSRIIRNWLRKCYSKLDILCL